MRARAVLELESRDSAPGGRRGGGGGGDSARTVPVRGRVILGRLEHSLEAAS